MSSTSPPKKPSFRSRVGTVMRRSSTAFSIPGRSGSATPPPPDSDTASIAGSISGKHDRDESTSSLNKLQPPSAPVLSSPSPIPESPAREAAALLPDPASSTAPKEHSPLAAQVVTAESQSARSQTPPSPEPSVSQPAAEDAQQPSELLAPTDVQPIPSVTIHKESDSKLDVATVLTDEPEELPVAESQPQPPAPVPAPESVPASKPSTPPPRASVPPPAPATPSIRMPVQPSVPSTPAARGPTAQSTPPTQPTTSSFGYFDIPRGSTTADGENPANVWADHARSREVTSSPENVIPVQERVASQKQSMASLRRPGSASSYGVAPALQSRKPSRSSFQPREKEIAGSTYTWSNSSGIGFSQSKGPAARSVSPQDPFVDPKPAQSETVVVPAQAVAALSPAETIHVPEPFDPRSPRDDSMIPAADPVPIPLLPMHEVISRPSRQTSGYDLNVHGSDRGDYLRNEADERRPLLASRPATPPINTGIPRPTACSEIARSYRSSNPPVAQPMPQWAQPRVEMNGSARNYSYGSVSRPYAERGWYEYVLPHGLRYFGHPDKRATTDIDLRNFSKLDEVTRAVDSIDGVPEGCEAWVRPAHRGKAWGRKSAPSQLVVCWVDHRYRRILSEMPTDDFILTEEDEKLDDEYRYWSYIEMHPAHVVLLQPSRQEAADVLHWSYTDRLLSHPQPVQPPFSQDECQELLRLVNDPRQLSSLSYNRMIARILLRVAHWRQVHFRPHKPLPRDVSTLHPSRESPMLRTVLEIVVGILCLGIPFLFVDRARYTSHFDVEGNTAPPSSAPLFIVGACACLVSAIILSASVTLMTLPGLGSIARIGGLVAISCSVLSMVTSFVSIFRYKSEIAQGAAHAAGEGFVLLPRRSIMLSLPLVFLAYSVAGFITGVVVYSFRSATINFAHAGMPVASKFDEYARWMVVGVLGALTGVLIASVIVTRGDKDMAGRYLSMYR
ncbi:hypothetical protein ID866_6184 [Astraeus odoratus]|nr:hypothetical protein ID866_6184 [Astraeus odoratus]